MIALESDRLRAEIDPAFGARVTALWDKRAGREWLVTGPREGGDVYGGAQARGWDECFPTVAPCEDPDWGSLRDHGLLWGRPWKVAAHGQTIRATFEEGRFAFTRTLDLHGATLTALYELESRADRPLPWMWSQHLLLASRPGERILAEGAWGWTDGDGAVSWPIEDGRDLSLVEGPEAGFARKLYARVPDEARAALFGEEGGIALEWSGAEAPALGLWIDWGGWPEGAPVHQLALEPATAPADDLATARKRNAARVLDPGAIADWRVAITLLDPP